MKVLRSSLHIFKYVFLMLMVMYTNYMYHINNQVIMFLEYVFILVVMALPFKEKIFNDFKKFELKKTFKKNIRTYLIGFLFMFITNLVIQLIIGDIAPNEEANRKLLKSMPVFYALVMCLLTPLIEEISFRLSFYDTFKNKKTSIIVTGILFGFMHVILAFTSALSLLFFVPYTVLGLTFSYIYFNEKNIFSSTLFHCFHNLLSIIVIFLTGI